MSKNQVTRESVFEKGEKPNDERAGDPQNKLHLKENTSPT